MTETFMKSLTTFQKSICEPLENESVDHPANTINSEYFRDYRKCTWAYHKSEIMKVKSSDLKSITYMANPLAYGILHTDLCQKLPSITCKEGYKARWIPNIMSNIFKNGKLVIGDDLVVNTIDTFYINSYNQSMVEPHLLDTIEINNGTVKHLQEWNSYLPPDDNCSLELRWFYSEDISMYFPLHLCGDTELDHVIEYDNRISSLLKIVNISTNKIVKFPEGIHKIGDGPPDTLLSPPHLWVEYLYLAPPERNFNTCTANSLKSQGIKNCITYTDIVSYTSPSVKIDEKVSIPITTRFPVSGIMWAAQRDISQMICYSSSPEGWSPIQSSSLITPQECIFENLPSNRTNRIHSQRHFKCVPQKQGFNYWLQAGKYKPLNPQPGIVMYRGALEIELGDTNPWKKPTPHQTFKCKVALMVTKRLVFDEKKIYIEGE